MESESFQYYKLKAKSEALELEYFTWNHADWDGGGSAV